MKTGTELLTLADYAALDESEDLFVSELVRGVVVREPRPKRRHGRAQVRMAAVLDRWARGAGAEVTTVSGYVLSEDPATVRGPDVAVVLASRLSEGEIEGWWHGAPDVVVEVLSPSDTSTAIQQKTLEYLEAGARLVWIVDPAARTVMVFRSDGSARVLREVDELEGEDVLPGFSVPLAEVFEGV